RYEPAGVAVTADAAPLLARDRTIERLAPLVDLDTATLRALVEGEVASILAEDDRDARVVRWRRPRVVREEAPFEVVARVVERELDLPGVRIVRRYRRLYPRGEVAAHLVGTLGAPSADEQRRDLAAGL